LYSSLRQTKTMSISKTSPKGYLAAAIGGFSGTVLVIALMLLFSRAFLTFFPQATINSALVMLIVFAGVGFGEVIGCFTALRLRHHTKAKTTALWLLALMIPGFLAFFLVNFLIGSLLAISLIAIALPLIARAFTQHPNYPNIVQQVMHTYAKRPPNF
jgi:hypothetical protein